MDQEDVLRLLLPIVAESFTFGPRITMSGKTCLGSIRYKDSVAKEEFLLKVEATLSVQLLNQDMESLNWERGKVEDIARLIVGKLQLVA